MSYKLFKKVLNLSMEKQYTAKKNGLIHTFLIVLILLPTLSIWLDPSVRFGDWLTTLLLSLPLAIVLWVYFSTKYWIENERIHYRCMFIKGSIPIHEIKSITPNKTSWVGVRPALATKGLIIRYQKYEEIYLAPESNSEFINDLLTINPAIKIQ